jgi:endonuclease III
MVLCVGTRKRINGYAMTTNLKQLIKIDRLLSEEYGRKKFSGGADPLTELVRTVLSQNTNDINRDRAFESMKAAYPSWEKLAEAPIGKIATAIKVAGLAKIRATRISRLLKAIHESQGRYSLEFLADWQDEAIREYLIKLEGIGPKTVACVMAFSLGRNVMPVDTHVFRVSQRLGIIPPKMSVAAAHVYFDRLKNMLSLYQFHLNLIAHGRQICHARKPECAQCRLRADCSYYKTGELRKLIAKPKNLNSGK